MKAGDLVYIKETEKTRSLGIAGGPGRVVEVKEDVVRVLYTDRLFGPAGPLELSFSDVEVVTKEE